MELYAFPVIDPEKTGRNILRLRKARGLSVKDLQRYFAFDSPRAIYKWQKGQSLPTVDNLLALSVALQTPMEQILVTRQLNQKPQAAACGSFVACAA